MGQGGVDASGAGLLGESPDQSLAIESFPSLAQGVASDLSMPLPPAADGMRRRPGRDNGSGGGEAAMGAGGIMEDVQELEEKAAGGQARGSGGGGAGASSSNRSLGESGGAEAAVG